MDAAENTDCFVCRKHRGEIEEPGGAIYDDGMMRAGHALSAPDGAPAYLGYLFVEPRRHAAGLADLTNQEAQALGVLVARLSRALIKREGAAHVYAFVLGDQVAHLHVHLISPLSQSTPRILGRTCPFSWTVRRWARCSSLRTSSRIRSGSGSRAQSDVDARCTRPRGSRRSSSAPRRA